jgi:hypothetical protein
MLPNYMATAVEPEELIWGYCPFITSYKKYIPSKTQAQLNKITFLKTMFSIKLFNVINTT